MNKTEKNIYKAFFETKKSKLYFNELKELTKASNSSLQNFLNKLENNKTIKREKTTSNTFYIIDDKKIFSLEFSKLSYENFQNLNINVKIPLKNFLKEIPLNIYTIILFGSASIKQERKGSDIDILIVSNEKNNFKSLKDKINITSVYPLSIFSCSINEFIVNNDDIIIQAKKTGFPINKEQNFYDVILNEFRESI